MAKKLLKLKESRKPHISDIRVLGVKTSKLNLWYGTTRVKSYEFKVEKTSSKLKSKSWNSKLRVQIHKLWVQTHELRVETDKSLNIGKLE